MIEKSFQPTVKLFFKATREILNDTWPVKTMTIAAVLFPVIVTAVTIFTSFKPSSAIWGGAFGLTIYTFAILPFIQFMSIKRNLTSNPSANQTQKYTLSDQGLRNFGSGVDVNLDWTKIIKIRSSENFVLFYIAKNMAYFIPKELVSDTELAQITQWHSRQCG